MVLLCTFTGTSVAHADGKDEFDKVLSGYVDGLDLSSLEEEYEEYSSFFEGASLAQTLKKYLSGDLGVGYEGVVSYLVNSVVATARSRVSEISAVLFVAVMSAVVGVLRKNADDGVNRVCSFVFSGATIALLSTVFLSYLAEVKKAVYDAAKVVQVFYPVILTLFTALGAGASGGVFTPAVSFLGGAFVSIIAKLLLPLIGVNFAFMTVGNLSDGIKLGKFSEFFRSAFKWIMGFSVFVFCFFLSAQSITSSAFDGISFKALKYAFSSGVPLVSQLVQSGFDVAFASLLLVKNSVGTIAMIILVIKLLTPIVEIAAMSLVLRLVSACVEPMGAPFASKGLSGCADCFSLFSAVLVSSGVCFLLTLFLMIAALGGSV